MTFSTTEDGQTIVYFDMPVTERVPVSAALRAEYEDLLSSLGLDKQRQQFIQPAVQEADGEMVVAPPPCIYPRATQQEANIIAVMFPQYDKLFDYIRLPIPLQVLHRIKEAVANSWFEEFTVHYPVEAAADDPILIGWAKDGWQKFPHVIAQWGREAAGLDVLLEQATTKLAAILETQAAEASAVFGGSLVSEARARLTGAHPLNGEIRIGVQPLTRW